MNESEQRILSDVEKYGLHIIHIIAEDDLPAYSFSIGLFKNYNHPEIVFIGLKNELTHVLINNIASDVKGGKIFACFKYFPDILEGFDCYFIDVDKSFYSEYFGYANWFYRGYDYPVIQCIYPTTKGVYPWEVEWPEEIKNLQPILAL